MKMFTNPQILLSLTAIFLGAISAIPVTKLFNSNALISSVVITFYVKLFFGGVSVN